MKSLIELAFDFISEQKDGVSFSKLWDHVKNEANLDEEAVAKRISQFYTNLMLDGRFVNLGDNTWDLRNRHTFDKVHIDMKMSIVMSILATMTLKKSVKKKNTIKP